MIEKSDITGCGMRSSGITLIEVLVSVAIFGMVVASVMRFSDYVMRRIVTVRSEVEHLDRTAFFLRQFSADVRDARQILYSEPNEIGIWRVDDNSDSIPDPMETVGYAWDGADPGSVYRLAGGDSAVALPYVRELKFAYDREGPNTRHVIVEVEVGRTAADVRRYHFSLNLRASELN